MSSCIRAQSMGLTGTGNRVRCPDNLWACTRQTGIKLGVRLKAAWEWAAVMGQVEVYGWQTFDVRYCP